MDSVNVLLLLLELLHNPRVIFLDEPTSGLDSATAESVVHSLKALSQSGRIVLCTIHQPKYEIFSQFDRLILLSQGKTVYNGDNSKAIKYFEKISHPVPEFINPADHFIRVVNPQVNGREDTADVQIRLNELYTAFSNSEMNYALKSGKKNDMGEQFSSSPGFEEDEMRDTEYLRRYKSSYHRINRLRQFQILFKRAFFSFLRDKPTNFGLCINNIVFPILIGVLFFQIPNTLESVRDKQGALFNVLVYPHV